MKRYFTALCMAWGNFCFIPGLKRWDENQRSLMLGWLPTIGLAIGLVWAGMYFGLVYASFPYLLVTLILTFCPFILSGFIHVDGFMDCNDALLSRGTLEKKQSILKDSRCGTFAIITIVFTVLVFYSCIGSAVSLGIDFVNLIAIVVISRSVAGLEVLLSKPMQTSQYREMYEASCDAQEAETPATIKQGVYLLVIQLIIYLAAIALICTYYLSTALVVVATVLGTLIAAVIAKKNLGGMNGDIAGYSIIWGEMVGVIMLSLV